MPYQMSCGQAKAASVAKQGAYGKVKIHKHSILSQLMHGSEVWAALRAALKLDPAFAVPKLDAEAPASQV